MPLVDGCQTKMGMLGLLYRPHWFFFNFISNLKWNLRFYLICGNCSSLRILTENRDKTLGNELEYFKWNQIKGHLFVTSSSLCISCDFNLSSKMGIIYGVYFFRGKRSFCGVNQNLICPHTFNILLRFTWGVFLLGWPQSSLKEACCPRAPAL